MTIKLWQIGDKYILADGIAGAYYLAGDNYRFRGHKLLHKSIDEYKPKVLNKKEIELIKERYKIND